MDGQVEDVPHAVHVEAVEDPPQPWPALQVGIAQVSNNREESELDQITLAFPNTFLASEFEDLPGDKDEEQVEEPAPERGLVKGGVDKVSNADVQDGVGEITFHLVAAIFTGGAV